MTTTTTTADSTTRGVRVVIIILLLLVLSMMIQFSEALLMSHQEVRRSATTAAIIGSVVSSSSCCCCSTSLKSKYEDDDDDEVQQQQIYDDAMEQFALVERHFANNNNNYYKTKLIKNAQQARDYLKQFDAILFDCDGVLHRGAVCTPKVRETLEYLIIELRKDVIFVTNNSSKSRRELRDKLSTLLQINCLEDRQMVPSSYSCAIYLSQVLKQQQQLQQKNKNGDQENSSKVIYVIGSAGLCDEIRQCGFEVVGGPSTSDHNPNMTSEEIASYVYKHDVTAVVVGLDTGFSYRKLSEATLHLQRDPNTLFVATNEDAFDVVGKNRHLPGNGALVRALEHSSQRKAVCVGKPSSVLADLISKDHHFELSKALMVGDRIDTDIQFGLNSGMQSMLVLTGCTSAQSLYNIHHDEYPHTIIPFIGLCM